MHAANTWGELRAALPHPVCDGEPITLVVQDTAGYSAWVCYPPDLAQVVDDWAALYPTPLQLWLVRGVVSLAEWSPPACR